jgi:hypothetical protein
VSLACVGAWTASDTAAVGASVSVEGQGRLSDDVSWMPPSIHLIHRFALNKPASSSSHSILDPGEGSHSSLGEAGANNLSALNVKV